MKTKTHLLALLLCAAIVLSACTGPALPSAPDDNVVNPSTDQTVSGSLDTEEDIHSSTSSSVPEGSTFEIHFLDVGQADAALILCDGETMMIDGGNSGDSSLVYSYLKNHGINHLNYVISTHAHEDHCGGLSGALSYASVDTVYSPVLTFDTRAFEKFVEKAEGRGAPLTVPNHGDTFMLGSAECTIIGPISESDDPNNTSIVVRIVYGNTSFLFTGDAETFEENEILDTGYTVSCDVLKVGHHGSETSTGYRWLREASPSYAVISVGADNDYGHPHEGTLSRLRDADVTVYRTDLQGTIICSSDGSTVSFEVERNENADTLVGAGTGGNHSESQTDDSGNITYVVNTNSNKFHEPNCSSVEDMSENNRMDVTSTREELIAQGYAPCGRCKP